MLTATQPAKVPAVLHVLLVGSHEEDFFLIRDILERSRSSLGADLDHAHSLDEAKVMLQQQPYGLVLFEHETGDAEAVHLLAEFLHAGVSVPFILLTENANEETVAEFIQKGIWNCVAKSQLDGATLVRTIRSTMALHATQRGQQNAEESLRKLSRAVEQSADMVMVTDSRGTIEYVNPAFEALTGFSSEEASGKLREFCGPANREWSSTGRCGRPSWPGMCIAAFWRTARRTATFITWNRACRRCATPRDASRISFRTAAI